MSSPGRVGGGRDVFEAILHGPPEAGVVVRHSVQMMESKQFSERHARLITAPPRCLHADGSLPPAGSELPHRAVFLPSVTVKEGYLHKYKAEGPQLLSRFAFKKRYFWLTSETLSYAKGPDWQVGLHATPRLLLVFRHSSP